MKTRMKTRFTALLVAALACVAAQAEPVRQAAANTAPAAAIGATAATATTVTAANVTTAATAAAATTGAAAIVSTQPRQRTRAEVIAEVVEARRNGTLIETEADMDVAQTRKQVAR